MEELTTPSPGAAETEVRAESPAEPAAKDKATLRSGEHAFTALLLACGLFALVVSLQLWFQMSEPRVSSAAALPLFVSGLWVLLTLLVMIDNRGHKTPLDSIKGFGRRVRQGLAYAFPQQVLIMLAAIAVYCVSMLLGLSFNIATPLFLWGTMCYLTRKNYLKNILWTAICMVFVIVVFGVVFGVVLP